MKIQSVTLKTVITINGVEHIREIADYTESINSAIDTGVDFESEDDVFDWIEIS